jgi:hypothetical protein
MADISNEISREHMTWYDRGDLKGVSTLTLIKTTSDYKWAGLCRKENLQAVRLR